MSKTSLNILIKKYTSGKISREEFLYFHALLSSQNMGNQPLNAEAIINAARQPRTPPPRHQPPQTVKQPQANPSYSSQTIDVDTEFNPAAFTRPPGASKHSRPSAVQGISNFFAQHYKQTAALVGIVGLMSTLVSNYFSTPTPEKIRNSNIVRSMNLNDDVEKDDSSQSNSTSKAGSGVESLAWSMIDKKSWARNDINTFITEWQELSSSEKRKAKKSAWYRQFSLVLTTNLAQQSSLANDGNISAVYIERALSDLTDTMKSGNRKQKTKIAARQQPKPRISDDENDTEQASAREERQEKIAKRNARNNSTNNTSNNAKKLTQKDINKLVARYIKEYENGKIKSIAKLFKDNRRRSNNRYSSETLNEYQSVFTNTQARSLQIDDLEWEIDQGIAEGEGRYNSILKLSNNRRKEIFADIKFKISLRGKTALFDSIRLVNLEANSIPTKITTARRNTSAAPVDELDEEAEPIVSKPFVESNKKNRRLLVGSKEYQEIYSDKAKPKVTKRKPTKTELNDLVSRYVDSYQYGDADEMITLFSGSTWTNDRSGVKQMRQDYQDIFDATSSRKMAINNLRWKFKKDKALGTGNLTLSSVSEVADDPDSELSLKKGKIRLVVELRDNEALISHLYQIFN